ncbi:Uncharacterized protein PBTT_02076 [Plasmodiophora brassicae]
MLLRMAFHRCQIRFLTKRPSLDDVLADPAFKTMTSEERAALLTPPPPRIDPKHQAVVHSALDLESKQRQNAARDAARQRYLQYLGNVMESTEPE